MELLDINTPSPLAVSNGAGALGVLELLPPQAPIVRAKLTSSNERSRQNLVISSSPPIEPTHNKTLLACFHNSLNAALFRLLKKTRIKSYRESLNGRIYTSVASQQPKVAFSSFTTDQHDAPDRFEAWREGIGVIFDVEPENLPQIHRLGSAIFPPRALL